MTETKDANSDQLLHDITFTSYGIESADKSLERWLEDIEAVSQKLSEVYEKPEKAETLFNEVELLREGIIYLRNRKWTKGELRKKSHFWTADRIYTITEELKNWIFWIGKIEKNSKQPPNEKLQKLAAIISEIQNLMIPLKLDTAEPYNYRPIIKIAKATGAAIAITLAGLGIMPKKCSDEIRKIEQQLIAVSFPEQEKQEDPKENISEKERKTKELRQELLETERAGALTLPHFFDRVEKELENAPEYETKEAKEIFDKEIPELKEKVQHMNSMNAMEEYSRLTKSPPDNKDRRNGWARSSQLISNPDKIANCEARLRARLRYITATRPDLLKDTHALVYDEHVELIYKNPNNQQYYRFTDGKAEKLTKYDFFETEIVSAQDYFITNFIHPRKDFVQNGGVATNSAISYRATKKLRHYRSDSKPVEKTNEFENIQSVDLKFVEISETSNFDIISLSDLDENEQKHIDWSPIENIPISIEADENFFTRFPEILKRRHRLDIQEIRFPDKTLFRKGTDANENRDEYFTYPDEMIAFFKDQNIKRVGLMDYDFDTTHFVETTFPNIEEINMEVRDAKNLQQLVEWTKKLPKLKRVQLRINQGHMDSIPAKIIYTAVQELEKRANVKVDAREVDIENNDDIQLWKSFEGQKWSAMINLTAWRERPKKDIWNTMSSNNINHMRGSMTDIEKIIDYILQEKPSSLPSNQNFLILSFTINEIDSTPKNFLGKLKKLSNMYPGMNFYISMRQNDASTKILIEEAKKMGLQVKDDRQKQDNILQVTQSISIYFGGNGLLANSINILAGTHIGSDDDEQTPHATSGIGSSGSIMFKIPESNLSEKNRQK